MTPTETVIWNLAHPDVSVLNDWCEIPVASAFHSQIVCRRRDVFTLRSSLSVMGNARGLAISQPDGVTTSLVYQDAFVKKD
jgi:hypothetical protein